MRRTCSSISAFSTLSQCAEARRCHTTMSGLTICSKRPSASYTNAMPPDMPAREIVADRAKDHRRAAGHVFAGVGAGAFDHRRRAGIAHREAFAGEAGGEQLAAGRAIKAGVADDGAEAIRLFRRRLQRDQAARETLADIVVGVAGHVQRDALHQERAEALPARAAQVHAELAFRQRLRGRTGAQHAPTRARRSRAGCCARRNRADASRRVRRSAGASAEEFMVERLRRLVAAKLRAIGRIRAIDAHQQRIEIEIVEMLGAAADLFDQIGAADNIFQAAEADHGEDFAHFLGDETSSG